MEVRSLKMNDPKLEQTSVLTQRFQNEKMGLFYWKINLAACNRKMLPGLRVLQCNLCITVLDAETPVTQKLTICSKWSRITLGIASTSLLRNWQSPRSRVIAVKAVEQKDLSKIPSILMFFSPGVVGVTGKTVNLSTRNCLI